MTNPMSESADTPNSRLVTLDSLYLSIMNDRVLDIYRDTEHLANALDAVQTKDDASRGVIIAVKAALLSNSELAGIVSEMFYQYTLPADTEVAHHEPQ